MDKNNQQKGAAGFCICPKCGEKVLHEAGTPCQKTKCPKCDSKMLREDSEHHQLLLDKQNKK